jgi:regulator of replication initiation timing
MDDRSEPSQQVVAGFSRLDAALARVDAAVQKVKAQRLAQAQDMVRVEVENERLREAVGEALAQVDGLIAKVEAGA